MLITGQQTTDSKFEGWSIESGENAQSGVNEKDKEIANNRRFYWPRLDIKEKFAPRFDCGINYHLRVYQVIEKYGICDRFAFKRTQNAEMNWNEAHNIREIIVRCYIYCVSSRRIGH